MIQLLYSLKDGIACLSRFVECVAVMAPTTLAVELQASTRLFSSSFCDF